MGEILGLGVTHGPYVLHPEDTMANILRRILASPKTPAQFKDSANWPADMQREWAADGGLAAAHVHRMRLVEGFRKARAALDAFKPDVVLIWGDDQYENFKEDIVPAFCVFAEDEFVIKPFGDNTGLGTVGNVWGESNEYELRAKGHRAAAKELAISLIHDQFDMAYAYKQLHHPFAHAFWRTVAHLDYDRKGFPYPIIPFHVNCYGSGFTARMGEAGTDPPGPSPERCFELGAAVARFFTASPYRVALVGSSSWSHAFLTAKNHFVWPDVPADRARFQELQRGDYAAWKHIPISQIEDSGQHEMLNWMCLAGAMEHLGRTPSYLEFVETWVFNSCKTIAIFEPGGRPASAPAAAPARASAR